MDATEELVRLKVRELRKEFETQAGAIVELSAIGFDRDRIAELLGTTPETVRNALTRARSTK